MVSDWIGVLKGPNGQRAKRFSHILPLHLMLVCERENLWFQGKVNEEQSGKLRQNCYVHLFCIDKKKLGIEHLKKVQMCEQLIFSDKIIYFRLYFNFMEMSWYDYIMRKAAANYRDEV